MKRIIALIILASFLFTNIGFAAEGGIHLAPPLRFGNLGDEHHKNVALATMSLEEHLQELDGLTDIDGATDVAVIKTTFQKSERLRSEQTATERTVYQPARITRYFNQVTQVSGHIFQVPVSVEKKGRRDDYLLLFSTVRNAEKMFPIVLCTPEQLEAIKEAVAERDRLPVHQEADKAAVERYIEQNEKRIDAFIDMWVRDGSDLFAEIGGRAEGLGWDTIYPKRTKPDTYWSHYLLVDIEAEVKDFLSAFNLDFMRAFDGKNMVFIRTGRDYPEIEVDGKKIIVSSHTSNQAAYFFLDRNSYYDLSESYTTLIGVRIPDISKKVLQDLARSMVHEMGAAYGLPYTVTAEGRLINDLDRAYEAYCSGRPVQDLVKQFPGLKGLTPVNLDTNLKTRDYAIAGGNVSSEMLLPTPDSKLPTQSRASASGEEKSKLVRREIQTPAKIFNTLKEAFGQQEDYRYSKGVDSAGKKYESIVNTKSDFSVTLKGVRLIFVDSALYPEGQIYWRVIANFGRGKTSFIAKYAGAGAGDIRYIYRGPFPVTAVSIGKDGKVYLVMQHRFVDDYSNQDLMSTPGSNILPIRLVDTPILGLLASIAQQHDINPQDLEKIYLLNEIRRGIGVLRERPAAISALQQAGIGGDLNALYDQLKMLTEGPISQASTSEGGRASASGNISSELGARSLELNLPTPSPQLPTQSRASASGTTQREFRADFFISEESQFSNPMTGETSVFSPLLNMSEEQVRLLNEIFRSKLPKGNYYVCGTREGPVAIAKFARPNEDDAKSLDANARLTLDQYLKKHYELAKKIRIETSGAIQLLGSKEEGLAVIEFVKFASCSQEVWDFFSLGLAANAGEPVFFIPLEITNGLDIEFDISQKEGDLYELLLTAKVSTTEAPRASASGQLDEATLAFLRESEESLPKEFRARGMDHEAFIRELQKLGLVELTKLDDKTVLIFSEKVTFENGLGKLLPKLAPYVKKVVVIATSDRERLLIEKINDNGPPNQHIAYADSVAAAMASFKAARYEYFKVQGDPEANLRGVTTFDITAIIKQIIEALGRVCGISEPAKILQLHEAAQKFAQAA